MFAIKVLNVNTDYNYIYLSHKNEQILRGAISIPCIVFRCVGDAVVFHTLEDARQVCKAVTEYLYPGLKLRIEEWDRPEKEPVKFIREVENYNEHKVEES